ncbi:MAG: DUF1289 domain-containing protein [Methylococcales bacterium]|nr:DUF1289 domain-containing protein [Methylococcales bacterium]
MLNNNASVPIATAAIASPCVKNCCLNELDVCLGCGRSLYEIKHWLAADQATQQRFLSNAEQRKQAAAHR